MLPEEYNELKEPVAEKESKKPNCWLLVKLQILSLCYLFIGLTSFLSIDISKHQKCDECLTPYKQDGNFCRNGENVYKNDCRTVYPHIVYGTLLSFICWWLTFLEFLKQSSLYL